MSAIYDHDLAEANGRRPSMIIWTIALAVVVFLAWAAIAWVAEIVPCARHGRFVLAPADHFQPRRRDSGQPERGRRRCGGTRSGSGPVAGHAISKPGR